MGEGAPDDLVEALVKPFAIQSATPLLKKRDGLVKYLEAAQRYYAKTSPLVDDTCGRPLEPLSIDPPAAQAIIQSMIDAVETDLRALGVDLSDD